MSLLLPMIKLAPIAVYNCLAMVIQRPLNPKKISPRALARILNLERGELQGYQWELIHQGTTARWRLHVPALNKVYFAKTNPPDFTTRFFGALFQLGLNEIGFYRDIAANLTIDKPNSFGLMGNRYRYLILIEDLSDQATFTDISFRCDLQQAESVIDTLANLHASCWQDARFDSQWQWVNRQQYQRNHIFLTLLRQQSSAIAIKRYKELLPENTPQIATLINQHYEKLVQQWGEGERTLVHGDAHIGNMYFKADGKAGLLDWQVIGYEHGMRDVTYFIINSLPTELRREYQQHLIERYTSRLLKQGINLDNTVAQQQYLLHASYVWISAAVTAASNTMQEEKIAAAGLIRASKAMEDLKLQDYLSFMGEK
ncbi:phosphotransferase [Oceanicoccus sp. KOV_DT_Chl]|uniref:phosphotransferase n=1 Tax=Oceanicoccus sp. KOV_DT_Chl TaxID=1904639 RepID=UPI00135BD0A0|nr:phosphotransferase [Oceanicoccus sp. KOV_DT_Chl]